MLNCHTIVFLHRSHPVSRANLVCFAVVKVLRAYRTPVDERPDSNGAEDSSEDVRNNSAPPAPGGSEGTPEGEADAEGGDDDEDESDDDIEIIMEPVSRSLDFRYVNRSLYVNSVE